MTIIEAIKSGKPFSNQSMIGAYMWIDELDGAVHRDHIADFRNLMWIRAKETPAPV